MSGIVGVGFSKELYQAKNKNDFIAFLKDNENLKETSKIHPWDEEWFSRKLEKGRYDSALRHIWDARNLPKDVASIGSYSFHAPILFECAVIAFQNAPSDNKLRTLQEVSWPLIAQGSFRTLQDAECSMDPSVKSAALQLESIYENRLKKEIRKSIGSDIPVEMSYQKKTRLVQNAVLTIAEKSKVVSLPSPNWIGESGGWLQYRHVIGVPSDLGLSMEPKAKHDEIRNYYAQREIDATTLELRGYNHLISSYR